MSNVCVYSAVVNNGPGPVSPWSLYIGILWRNSAVPWKQLNLFNKYLLLMTFETNNYSIRNDKNTICTALVKRTCRKSYLILCYIWMGVVCIYASLQVFCGKIPNSIFEDALIPLFEKCGTIYDLRLMMDPATGLNKTFCFVMFTTKEGAQTAVKQVSYQPTD